MWTEMSYYKYHQSTRFDDEEVDDIILELDELIIEEEMFDVEDE